MFSGVVVSSGIRAGLRFIKEKSEVLENIWAPDWDINQLLEKPRLLNDMVREICGTSFVQMIIIPIKQMVAV